MSNTTLVIILSNHAVWFVDVCSLSHLSCPTLFRLMIWPNNYVSRGLTNDHQLWFLSAYFFYMFLHFNPMLLIVLSIIPVAEARVEKLSMMQEGRLWAWVGPFKIWSFWKRGTNDLLAVELGSGGSLFSDKPTWYFDIYIYDPVFQKRGPPPNGMGPQVAPRSLLFASYWQHFWGPASYLLGFCSDSDYQPRIY